jgi:hypothetical protein
MEEHRLRELEWRPTSFRVRGRPKMQWEDDVKPDLKLTKIYHWKKTS